MKIPEEFSLQDYKNIKVWQKSYKLVLSVYKLTEEFPNHELYALTSQLRRAAASIPTNIAEGCGRNTDKDFARFLDIASGSASETDYHLLLSKDLKFIDAEHYKSLYEQLTEIRKMLSSLIRKIRNNANSD